MLMRTPSMVTTHESKTGKLNRRAGRQAWLMTRAMPHHAPNTAKVQFEPCQSPARMNVTMTGIAYTRTKLITRPVFRVATWRACLTESGMNRETVVNRVQGMCHRCQKSNALVGPHRGMEINR